MVFSANTSRGAVLLSGRACYRGGDVIAGQRTCRYKRRCRMELRRLRRCTGDECHGGTQEGSAGHQIQHSGPSPAQATLSRQLFTGRQGLGDLHAGSSVATVLVALKLDERMMARTNSWLLTARLLERCALGRSLHQSTGA